MKKLGLLLTFGAFLSVTQVNAEDRTIYEILKTDRQFTTVTDHVKTQGLEVLLSEAESDLIFFATTNRGFNAMPNLFRKALFAEDSLLKEVLEVHVVMTPSQLEPKTKLASVQGALVSVDQYQDRLSFGEAQILEKYEASNGTLYAIDWVVFPSAIRDRLPSIVGRPDNF